MAIMNDERSRGQGVRWKFLEQPSRDWEKVEMFIESISLLWL